MAYNPLPGNSSFNPLVGQPDYTQVSLHTSAYNIPIPIFWGQRRITPNLIWWGWPPNGPGISDVGRMATLPTGFRSGTVLNNGVAFKGSLYDQASNKKYGSVSSGDGGFDSRLSDPNSLWFIPCIFALCEGPIDAVLSGWDGRASTVFPDDFLIYYFLIPGTSSQPLWDFWAIFDPTSVYGANAEQLAYRNTAYIGSYYVICGSDGTIPQQAFLCKRHPNPAYASPGGDGDYSLADIIPDFLTSPRYGMGLLTGDIDAASLALFEDYQFAQNLFFSPLLVGQDKATDIIDRWAIISNSWIFYDGTIIRFVPLGDVALTANSHTYTPDITPAYALTINDFLDLDAPVTVDRKDPVDCYNRVTLQVSDAVNSTDGFAANPVEYKDQGLIDQFGVRDASSLQGDDICNIGVGQTVVNLIGKRYSYIRNTYSFTLSYRYIRVLPGTVLSLTEPNIGLSGQLVRVQSVAEAEDGKLSIVAEEITGTTGIATTQGSQLPGQGGASTQLASPGDVNAPSIFEPSSALGGPTPQLWISASGANAEWGGSLVFVSADNTNFTQIGRITAAPQGVLSSTLGSHSDPDTVNVLGLDFTESRTILDTSPTHADADAGRTLSVLAAQPISHVMPSVWELIAYGAVTSTGTFTDNLQYLRRGQYGTAPGSHGTGDGFTKLDSTALRWPIPAQYIGVTLYFKFLSFNRFGNSQQQLGDVTAYQFTATGAGFGTGTAGAPATPTGLTAVGGVGQVAVSWIANAPTDNVLFYVLYVAPGPSGAFGSAAVIFKGLATNFVYSGLPNSTTYTFFLIATNVVNASVHTAGVDATTLAPGSGIGAVVSGVDVKADPAHNDNAHVYVGSISGFAAAGGTIAFHFSTAQFDASQSSPTITQATQTSNVPTHDMFITTQAPFSGATGGNIASGTLYITYPTPTGFAHGTRWRFEYDDFATDATYIVWDPLRSDGTAVTPVLAQSQPITDISASNLVICAQPAYQTSATHLQGGALLLQGGIGASTGASGPSGAVRMQLGGPVGIFNDHTMVEACEVALGRHVTAINQYGTGITSTQMPANTGDRVTWIGNAATVPTAAPVGGAILYASNGELHVYQAASGGGVQSFQIQPAAVASVSGSGAGISVSPTTGAVVVMNTGVTSIVAGTGISISGPTGAVTISATGGSYSGVDVEGASASALYVQSISGTAGGGGAVALATNAWLSSAATGAVTLMVLNGTETLFADASNNFGIGSPTARLRFELTSSATAIVDLIPGAWQVQTSSAFGITYAATTSSPGASILLEPQGSTGALSGSVDVVVAAPGAGTAEAAFAVYRVSQEVFRAGPIPTEPAAGAVWLGLSAASSITNFAMSQFTGGDMRINDGGSNGSGAITFSFSGTEKIVFDTIARFDLPLGGLSGPLMFTKSAPLNMATTGTITLSAGTYENHIIVGTGTQTGNITIVFPSFSTYCLLDLNGSNVGTSSLFIDTSAVAPQQIGGPSFAYSTVLVYVDGSNHIHFCPFLH